MPAPSVKTFVSLCSRLFNSGRIIIGHSSPNARHLIGDNATADPGAVNSVDAWPGFAGADQAGYFVGKIRIVHSALVIGTGVPHIIAKLIQRCFKDFFLIRSPHGLLRWQPLFALDPARYYSQVSPMEREQALGPLPVGILPSPASAPVAQFDGFLHHRLCSSRIFSLYITGSDHITITVLF